MGIYEWFFNRTWTVNSLKDQIRRDLKMLDDPLCTATAKVEISRRVQSCAEALHMELSK